MHKQKILDVLYKNKIFDLDRTDISYVVSDINDATVIHIYCGKFPKGYLLLDFSNRCRTFIKWFTK